jgi:hypothetical protein
MTLSAAVGAPAPITIGDKTLSASPVNLFDLGTIEETVRTLILQSAARAAVGLPPDAAKLLLDNATLQAVEVSYASQKVLAYLNTFDGACRYVEASLQALHPDVRAADIKAAFKKYPDQYAQAVATVSRISGVAGDGTEGAGKGEGQGGA